jgi:putative phosphoesterase
MLPRPYCLKGHYARGAMRVAALYDVHGNLPALEAVLDDVEREQPDAIVVGGDMVSGPLPEATLERLRSLEHAHFIRGNADRGVVAIRRGEAEPKLGLNDAWIAARLSDEQIEFLADLPLTLTLDVDGLGRVCFCHATPRDDEEIFTERTPDELVAAMLAGTEEGIIVCGHTHIQVDRHVGRWRVVNAGSVGLPYDGEPGPRWTLLGPDVSFRRSELDRERATETIRGSGWPRVDQFLGDTPPRDEVLDFFEQMAAEQRGA